MSTDNTTLRKFALLAAAMAFAGIVASLALAAVSQIPLFLLNISQPNVMILLDNSGSMDIIMQHSAFDPTARYSGGFDNDRTYYQTTSNGYHYLSTGNDYIRDDKKGNFTKNSVTIKLPLPYDDTRWDGNYLNWLFYHATSSQRSTVSTDATLQKTRIQTARGVISNLVKTVSGVRFGLAKLNVDGYDRFDRKQTDGGSIVRNCGDLTSANVDTSVSGISAETWTPLGEALSEVWQYFKGGTSLYNTGVSYTSPITSSCQKSFTIVVTDGEPTYDGCYRGDFSSYGCDNAADADSHLADVAAHMNGSDATSAYGGTQSVTTYTIGMTIDSSLLRTTAENGGGSYYTTTSGMDLATALQNAVNEILGRQSSASAVAVSTAYLTSNTTLYRARFDSTDWSGYLEAYGINKANGAVTGYPNSPKWEAGALLNANSARTVYTAGVQSGVYRRVDFTSANAATLAPAGFMNFSSASTPSMIGYVRGDAEPAGYRHRASKLGDMVQSAPVILGPPDGYYSDNNYATFKRNNATRQSLILAGANDGMLHAFNADTGAEEWAFIPNILLPKLKLLRATPYTHTNYVNGAITVGDAFITAKGLDGKSETSSSWRTIAVCGLREGGKGYFALDVTDATNPIPLWEITNTSPSETSGTVVGLGYSFGTPLIVKLKDSSQSGGFRWVALLANGYEGTTSGRAATLIVADLATGAVIREIVADASTFSGVSPNGLATPAAIDRNADGFVDYVYAGDLTGHLWKFDLSSSNRSTWDVAWKRSGTPVALFRAKTAAGSVQPITTAPDVVLRGGYQIVFFGTGKYYESTDISSTQTQTFYGVYDYNSTSNPDNAQAANGALLARADLTAQTVTRVDEGGGSWRTSSNNPIGLSKGWYLDLPVAGERVITDPVARSRKIIFTTFIPSTNACSFGGISWLMELNMDTGGEVIRPVFDVNLDGKVDYGDTVLGDLKVKPTGTLLGDGLASTPAIVGAGDEHEYKYITKTTGEIIKLLEGGGHSQIGLRSWRQLK